MEVTIAVAAVSVIAGLFGKLAYDGIKNRNGGNKLASHNISAVAHPDIREHMGKMEDKVFATHDTVTEIKTDVKRLLKDSDG